MLTRLSGGTGQDYTAQARLFHRPGNERKAPEQHRTQKASALRVCLLIQHHTADSGPQSSSSVGLQHRDSRTRRNLQSRVRQICRSCKTRCELWHFTARAGCCQQQSYICSFITEATLGLTLWTTARRKEPTLRLRAPRAGKLFKNQKM